MSMSAVRALSDGISGTDTLDRHTLWLKFVTRQFVVNTVATSESSSPLPHLAGETPCQNAISIGIRHGSNMPCDACTRTRLCDDLNFLLEDTAPEKFWLSTLSIEQG